MTTTGSPSYHMLSSGHSTSFVYIGKRFKLWVQLGEVELQGVISLVSSVSYFLAHYYSFMFEISRPTPSGWFFDTSSWCAIVARLMYIKLELVFLGSSAPLYPPPPPVCKRRELHGTIGFEVSQGGYSSVRELVRILNAPNLRFQSPGWFFTFSFPWRFKLTTLAFSISRMIFWTLDR